MCGVDELCAGDRRHDGLNGRNLYKRFELPRTKLESFGLLSIQEILVLDTRDKMILDILTVLRSKFAWLIILLRN